MENEKLVREPEGMRRLGRPRRRWEDNIKMGLTEGLCDGVDWFQAIHGRI
jgi:hypothetical protein